MWLLSNVLVFWLGSWKRKKEKIKREERSGPFKSPGSHFTQGWTNHGCPLLVCTSGIRSSDWCSEHKSPYLQSSVLSATQLPRPSASCSRSTGAAVSQGWGCSRGKSWQWPELTTTYGLSQQQTPGFAAVTPDRFWRCQCCPDREREQLLLFPALLSSQNPLKTHFSMK